MEKRYEKNISALSREECKSLADKKVCVIGCGGLGGHIVEMLARIGVGHITVVDCDTFCESNLNRQLFSSEKNLGAYKAGAAKERIREVNSQTVVNAVTERFREENAAAILSGHDAAADALDNIQSRLTLQEYCRKLDIPLVHGAIAGWYGQVATVMPGDDTLSLIYKNASGKGAEDELGNLAFTAAATASVQCGEIVKLLTGRGEILSKTLLRIDLLTNEFTAVQLS